MTEDTGKALYEKIQAEFKRRCDDHYLIQNLTKKIEKGTADLLDVERYSRSLGAQLANAILETVTPEALPDERLYYNIARQILMPSLKNNYDMVNTAAAAVQETLDKKMQFRIKSQQAAFPTERVNAIIGAASDPTADWETIQRRLGAPVQNVTESFYTDYVKENAEFRSKAGLDVYIVRTDHGGCCDWCAKLAGKYRYPDDVPKDVYRRHDNCTCTVTYENGKQRQDVWSKKTWTADDETLEQRKELAAEKPTVLTKEQARILEMKAKFKSSNSLTNLNFDDIIELKGKMSDVDVRRWYIDHDKNISELIDKTQPLENQARQAHELRNKYKFQARELMEDQEKRKILDEKYPLKDFNYYYDKYSKIYENEDDIYKAIINSSTRPNSEVNKSLGLE